MRRSPTPCTRILTCSRSCSATVLRTGVAEGHRRCGRRQLGADPQAFPQQEQALRAHGRLHRQRVAVHGPLRSAGHDVGLETISAPDNAPYSTIRILTITDGGEESLGAIGRRIQGGPAAGARAADRERGPARAPSPSCAHSRPMAVLAGLSFIAPRRRHRLRRLRCTELIDTTRRSSRASSTVGSSRSAVGGVQRSPLYDEAPRNGPQHRFRWGVRRSRIHNPFPV